MSGLIKKIAKGLGEHFIGIETYRFYNQKRESLESIGNSRDIETCQQIKKNINGRKFDVLFFEKFVSGSLFVLGSVTLLYRLAHKDNMLFVFGLSTILLSELCRLFNYGSVRKDREKTIREVDSYVKSLKSPKASLDYVQG